MIPNPWEGALLGLAAWRVFRLVADDRIADRPRAWLLGVPGWNGEGDPPAGYRDGLAYLLTCPYCAGFWIACAWWGAWLLGGDWVLAAATPWAISAAPPLLETLRDDE